MKIRWPHTNLHYRRSLLRVFATWVLLIGVLGCSPASEPTGLWARLWKIEVGPDYQRPKVMPSPEFRSQVSPVEAASLSDLPWWKVFNDDVLQKLIAEALTQNYDLALASARVQQAYSMVLVQAADFYPQAGYEGFASREKTFVPFEQLGGNVTFNAFSGLLNAAWELDLWGRIRRSTEAARANLFAQQSVRRGVMLTLVSNVAANYFSLIELDRELSIAQESAKTYKETLGLFTQRFEFGKDSKLPVARAQAAYESSLATIAAVNRAIVQQENALSILLGTYPGDIARGMHLTEQSLPTSPVGLTTDLIERRPDILAAEQNMIEANAEIGVAVANFFPRVGISALYGGQSPRVGDVLENSFSVWNITAGLSGPLFQGGRLIENYHVQQAFWDATIAQYKQTILVGFREVSDALIAQQTLIEQRAALQRQVASLRDAVDLALLRYNGGRASYFEVLEAEQQLFPAEDALAQTQRDQLLAMVNLYKALGGGWNLTDMQWIHPD